MGPVQVYVLMCLCLVRIGRIGRLEEFKIHVYNSSAGNLQRQSCQTSMTERLCVSSQQPKHIDSFCKKTPPQTSYQILIKDLTRGAAKVGCGWNASA